MMEPFFTLAHYGGMTWDVYYNWPITYRRWYIKRLNEEMERASKGGESQQVSKAPQHNDPGLRELQGKRPFTPHNLKR